MRRLFCLLLLLHCALGSSLGQVRHKPKPFRPASSFATNQVVVILQPGADPFAYAAGNGLRIVERFHSDPNAYIFEAASPMMARFHVSVASHSAAVRGAYENRLIVHRRSSFTPNDPYFVKDTPNAGWPGQWYLENPFTAGLDVNIISAWNRDLTGSGVIIGILDDGFEITHPDLAANYDAANSFDIGQNDSDPSPATSSDVHGTPVAGLAAAVGGNGAGISGAAPFAHLAGIRLDFQTSTSAKFADATLYHSSGGNTNIKIKNHSYGLSDPLIDTPLELQALATSTAAGTIHVFAAGNERNSIAEDCSKIMVANSPNAITVSAVGSDGTFANYSSFGGNVFCCAPSSSDSLLGVESTDLLGAGNGYDGDFPDPNFTADFGGTSASAPLVSGILATLKQAEPNLTTRYAKHLLARSSNVVNQDDNSPSSDGGWKTNAAGFKFNPNYGFGLIDAGRLADALNVYVGVTALQTENIATVNVAQDIPDFDSTGLTQTFAVTGSTPLEEVQIRLNVAHTYRGDLEAFLTSPSGTKRRLFMHSSDPGVDMDWSFTSNAFWGENPQGTWSIQLIDAAEFDVGTWNSFSATMRMGTVIGIDKVSSVTLTSSSVFGGVDTTGTVNLGGPARQGGAVVALSSNSAIAAVPASITIPAGAQMGGFSITTTAVAQSANVTITAARLGENRTAVLTVRAPIPSALSFTPQSVLGGTPSVGSISINVPAPAGGLDVALADNNDAANEPPTLTIPAGQTSAQFDVQTNPVTVNQPAAITATCGGLGRTAVLTITRSIIDRVTLSNTTVTGGASLIGTVYMTGPVPLGGANVLLSSSNTAAATVAAFTTIPQFTASRTFPIQTYPVAASTNVIITAVRAGLSRTAVLTVARPVITSVSVSPTIVGGGNSSVGTVTIGSRAPIGGTVINLTSSNPVASVPATVTIPAGNFMATFVVNTSPVTANATSIIRGELNGALLGATISVYPTTLLDLTTSATQVVAGGTVTGVVTLSVAAPAGGAGVVISSSNPALSVPASVIVPAGAVSKSFSIVSHAVSVDTNVTISAARSGIVKTKVILVKKP